MVPTLKISEAIVNPCFYLRFNISGAAYPGVPHFPIRYFYSKREVARPKSPITKC